MSDIVEILSVAASVVEVSAPGPVGPPGPSGPAGVNGANGADGLDASFSLYESEVPDTTPSMAVGGAPSQPASVWKTRTIVGALDAILFPTLPPVLADAASVSLSVTGPTGTLEVGSTHNRTLQATFNRGRINNGDGTQGPPLVGAPYTYSYSAPSTANTPSASTSQSFNNVPVLFGLNSFSVLAFYNADSSPYYDNKGAVSTIFNSQRGAGTLSSSGYSTPIIGAYPWYHLRSPVAFTAAQFAAAITALGNSTSGTASNIDPAAIITKVVASASDTLAVPYNISGQFLGVAYESDNTTKTRYHVTALDNGPITLVFNTMETQSSVSQSSSSPRWTRGFKMHVSTNPLTNSNATIELRNS